jgi:hypothetical protein
MGSPQLVTGRGARGENDAFSEKPAARLASRRRRSPCEAVFRSSLPLAWMQIAAMGNSSVDGFRFGKQNLKLAASRAQ